MTVAFCLGVSATSSAAPITFAFQGNVTRVTDPIGALGSAGQSLTTFSGSYTFESTTPNAYPEPQSPAFYDHRQPPAGIRMDAGPFSFRPQADELFFRIYVADNWGFAGADEYLVSSHTLQAFGTNPAAPIDRVEVSWIADTHLNDPFSDVSLPLTPPNLAAFQGNQFLIVGECSSCSGSPPTFEIQGTLTSLTLANSTVRGDLNFDGIVDRADAALFLRQFGATTATSGGALSADFSGDERVGLADLLVLQGEFTPDDSPFGNTAAAVPEPTALAMIAAAASVALWRRRQ